MLLKRICCLNISAFCRETIAEKLERLEGESLMLAEVQKRNKVLKDLQQLLIFQIRQEYNEYAD